MKRQDAGFAHPQKKRTGICHKSWYVFVCGREKDWSCSSLFSRAVLHEENAKNEHQRTGDDPFRDGFMEEENSPGQREKDHCALQKCHHLE